MSGFPGLPADFFVFFRELKRNSDRAWFEDNKERYRDHVQAPLGAFIEAMAPPMRKISKHFICDPRPNGGSASIATCASPGINVRIRRMPAASSATTRARTCTRRDSTCISRRTPCSSAAAYHPEPQALAKIRAAIATRQATWKKVGAVRGEALARPPRGFDAEHPLIADIKRKSFFRVTDADVKLAQSPALTDAVGAAFRDATSLVRFLCGALEVPF